MKIKKKKMQIIKNIYKGSQIEMKIIFPLKIFCPNENL
jgi:hypothetical protein